MSVKFWNLLLVFALLLSLSVGGGILYQNHLAKQAEQARIKAEEMQKLADQQRRDRQVKADFEAFLNTLLQQIATESELYKKSRMVLTGLIEPANMTRPEYIQENAALAETTMTTLKTQMDKIMDLFAAADQRVEQLTAEISPEARETILESWKTMREEEAGLFIQYFESEQNVLDNYKVLIDFYAQKRDVLEVDPVANIIIFNNPEDLQQAGELRAAIKDLTIEQGHVFLKSIQEPPVEDEAADAVEEDVREEEDEPIPEPETVPETPEPEAATP